MLLPKFSKIDLAPALVERLLSVANAAADAASLETLAHFRQAIDVENKEAELGRFDPVTIADKNAERVIKKAVLDVFPEHGFFGEESEQVIKTDQPLWIVDPIDGTRAFITGMPLWGTLIAVYDGADVVLGMLEQPFLKERYIGSAFGGHENGVRSELVTPSGIATLKTRTNIAIKDAIVQTTTPEFFDDQPFSSVFERLKKEVSMVRYGGDCYCYALLAMGLVDVVIETSLQPYDIAALIPIVEGAGGVISNWDGESAANGGAVVASGSERLHADLLKLIANG